MSDMKCPFCQQELEEDIVYRGRVFVSCNNPNCIISDWGGCSKQIITEIIRTRKALAFAKSKLNGIHRLYSKAFYTREDWLQVCMEMVDKANTALEQITAHEQKEG